MDAGGAAEADEIDAHITGVSISGKAIGGFE